MEMDIISLIVAAVAMATSGGGLIAIFAGFLNKFSKMKKALAEMAEAKELRGALVDAHNENVNLKKTIVKLVEKLENVHYTDDEFIDNYVETQLNDIGINVEDYYPENLEATKQKIAEEAAKTE